jgi:hypothetical protein
MSLLAPMGLLLLTLAVPIILLWMFRQKREPVEVPTNFLWRKAAEEERVSPIIRNLLKSLLLFLQLAAILLFALAASDVVLDLRLEGKARRVILLLDRSASMATIEGVGRTRLDMAREKIETLLSTFRGGDRAMLVTFHKSARIVSGFTEDEETLMAVLRGIRPTDAGTDPAEALRVAEAASAALPKGSAEILLFSDGAFPPIEALPEGLADSSFTFVGLGEKEQNAGITDLDLSAGLETPARLYVRVANPGLIELTRTLTLQRGDATLDAREATLAAGSTRKIVFDLAPWGPGAFEVRLDPADDFPADDVARAVLATTKYRRILVVTEGNDTLDRLKDLHPMLEVYAIAPGDPSPGLDRIDLTIFDGFSPEGIVPGEGRISNAALWLDCVPPGSGVTLAERLTNPVLVDWDRDHPLNRSVDWGEVLVAEASPVQAPVGAVPLLETTEGPLLAALPGAGLRVVAGFRLENSSMPLRLAFPIFFANLLENAFREGSAERQGYIRTGEVFQRPLPTGAAEIRIATPDGREVPLEPLPDDTVAYSDTERAGFYRVLWSGGETGEQPLAVSLLDPAETAIAPREVLEIGKDRKVSDPGAVEANYPLRRLLLVLALLVLLAEWLVWLRTGRRRTAPKIAGPDAADA